jgi:hypothetical protein
MASLGDDSAGLLEAVGFPVEQHPPDSPPSVNAGCRCTSCSTVIGPATGARALTLSRRSWISRQASVRLSSSQAISSRRSAPTRGTVRPLSSGLLSFAPRRSKLVPPPLVPVTPWRSWSGVAFCANPGRPRDLPYACLVPVGGPWLFWSERTNNEDSAGTLQI